MLYQLLNLSRSLWLSLPCAVNRQCYLFLFEMSHFATSFSTIRFIKHLNSVLLHLVWFLRTRACIENRLQVDCVIYASLMFEHRRVNTSKHRLFIEVVKLQLFESSILLSYLDTNVDCH